MDTNIVQPAKPRACKHCPWRLANQGKKPDPHGFYTKANLKRLWTGMRHGARMTCHPTDVRMIDFEGAPHGKDGKPTHECTGALMLQQRAYRAVEAQVGAGQKAPMRAPLLSRDGLAEFVARVMFGGTMLGGAVMPQIEQDPEVGYAPLDEALELL